MVTASMKLKTCLLFGRKAMTNLDSRHDFVDKGMYSQSYGFSRSHVWMWKLDHVESWVPKNSYFLNCGANDSWDSFGQKGDQTIQS